MRERACKDSRSESDEAGQLGPNLGAHADTKREESKPVALRVADECYLETDIDK